ncbi:MAG: hypothetical protein PVF80_16055, partial [Gammaproteobacteria bacterium]
AGGYRQYEVSAWSRERRESRHNLNYWHFGDYLGIGAGAHGKITLGGENRVLRRVRQRQPRAYLENAGRDTIVSETDLSPADLCFEFMLNALRLKEGFPTRLFHDNTGLGLEMLLGELKTARDKGLLHFDAARIRPTEAGFRHLNDLQELFLTTEKRLKRPIFDTSEKIMHN